MRRNVLRYSLFAVVTSLSTISFSQGDRFAYVITDVNQQGSNWQFLRKMDLQTGQYSPVLLQGNDINYLAYDATTRKQFSQPLQDTRFGNYVNAPFATGVAAIALDKKNNRLFYTPMLFDQLRYIDLRTMKVYYITDRIFTGKPVKSSSQGDIVTRMAIASDGNGYAMTNDASQLIQFTTGKKVRITDLGGLVDDPANKISIHNSCSSFGGDMIADDNGNLYVFSARNQVFRVNIESKVATHLGVIRGLPQGFTVNGAVVTGKNEVVVASAVQATNWYMVDLRNLSATVYALSGDLWQSSDLGNSNVLVTKPKVSEPDIASRSIVPQEAGDGRVRIFPNPVTGRQFVVQFQALEAGSYTVQVTDVMGRQVVQQVITVTGEKQLQTIRLNEGHSKGIYLVKVLDAANEAIYSNKLVIQ
jgi:hypothetical protein